MPIFSTANATLHIGGVLSDQAADFTVSDFSGQTWVQVNNLEDLGSLGDSSEEIQFNDLSSSRTKRIKGTRSAGTMQAVIGVDYSDAGQTNLIAAEKTRDNYAFKITFDDAPSGGTPSERYFIAIVGSAEEVYDTANSVMRLNASLWVNSNVVRVAAAAA